MSVRFDGRLDTYETLLFLEERLGLGLFVWNLDTGDLQWSDGMHLLFGTKPEKVQPSTKLTLSMIHPDDRASSGWLRHEAREGVALDREFRIMLHDGRVRHIRRCSRVINQSDNAKLATGACVDVTSLHEASARANAAHQRLRTTARALNGLVWLAPSNPNVIEAVNLSHGDAVQQHSWPHSIHPDDASRVMAAWQEAINGKTVLIVTHRILQPDGGYRWVQTRAAPLTDRDGTVVEWIGATLDIHHGGVGEPTAEATQLTGAQVRGARGILNWSVRELANAASTSVSVLRRIEAFDGPASTDEETIQSLRQVMERGGVEFFVTGVGKPAVRPR
jgi:PAS domain-containing protein